ncbi:MAG: SH3 domain-containing protein [Pseudomonadota bacterium]
MMDDLTRAAGRGLPRTGAWAAALLAAVMAAGAAAAQESGGAGLPVATTPPTSDPAPTTGSENARRAAAQALAPERVEAAATGPRKGPVTGLPLPRYVSLKAAKANIRRGPGLDRRVDWVFLRRGMPLQVIAEHGHWRRVRDMDSAVGWVHYSLIRGDRTAVVREEIADIRDDPSEAGRTVARAERGVVMALEACEAGWCEVSKGRVEGWVEKAAIWGAGRDEVFD